jgi:hypothetical protein
MPNTKQIDAARLDSEPRVLLPTLAVAGYSGWLCTVCLRAVEPDRRPWSWFGCENCRAVDKRVAGVFGARRFLPLGQHSIMNGLSLSLDESSDARVVAFHDQCTGLIRGWEGLDTWRAQEADRLGAIVREAVGDDVDEVPLSRWTELLPPGPQASARAYRGLLLQQYPWLIELDSRFDDVAWLAGDSEREG